MRDGVLVSMPITLYDDVVKGCATPAWQSGARVVGQAMAALYEREDLASDAFLWGRVRALAGKGVLEIDGDRSIIRAAKVRRV